MDKTEKLRKLIIEKYGSIRAFSKVVNIPSTTLTSALDKGIGGMSVDKVIKICEELAIDVKTFEPVSYGSNLKWREETLLKNYNKLNSNGKHEAEKRVEELTRLVEYTYEEPKTLQDLKPTVLAAHDDNLTDDEKAEADRRILEAINKMQK